MTREYQSPAGGLYRLEQDLREYLDTREGIAKSAIAEVGEAGGYWSIAKPASQARRGRRR